MSLEKNKAIIRKVNEALNKRDLAVLDGFMTSDYVDHTNQLRGWEDVKQFYTNTFKGFPDYHETVEDITAEGDRVWVRYKFMGTHTGEYRRLAPTSRKVIFTAISVWRIVEGKIVEKESTLYDSLDFYKQLGVIEYKGFPDEDVS